MNYELSAIITPGLEREVLSEYDFKRNFYFDEKISIKTRVENGAVVFSFSDPSFFHIIKILRSPTKFTLKIAEFKCRDFPRLFTKLNNIKWQHYIYTTKFSISSSCKKSRIIHSDRVIETTKRSIQKWLAGNPRKKLRLSDFTNEQKILINIDNDHVTVKVDCSGEPNYKRNLRETKAIAPLRENYAYILLAKLTNNFKDTHDNHQLLDPMCGSGTFLSEALEFYSLNDKRDFSYEHFYFLRNLPKILVKDFNLNQKMVFTGVEKNNFLKEFHRQNYNDIQNINFIYEDFFDLKKFMFNTKETIFICNLPYGKRIKTHNEISNFYKKFLTKIAGMKGGVLLPSHYAKQLKLKSTLEFSNGGISVSFCQINPSFNTHP